MLKRLRTGSSQSIETCCYILKILKFIGHKLNSKINFLQLRLDLRDIGITLFQLALFLVRCSESLSARWICELPASTLPV